jgi:hypothetical protein
MPSPVVSKTVQKDGPTELNLHASAPTSPTAPNDHKSHKPVSSPTTPETPPRLSKRKNDLLVDDEAEEEPRVTHQRLASFSMISPEEAGKPPAFNPEVTVPSSKTSYDILSSVKTTLKPRLNSCPHDVGIVNRKTWEDIASEAEDAEEAEDTDEDVPLPPQKDNKKPPRTTSITQDDHHDLQHDGDIPLDPNHDTFSLSDFLGSNGIKIKNETTASNLYIRNDNRAYVGYEYLRGNMILFTAWTNDDSDSRNTHAYCFHAIFGCNRENCAPFDQYACKGVMLSKGRNTDDPLISGIHNAWAVIVLANSKHTKKDTSSFLTSFVDFLNSHTYVAKNHNVKPHLIPRHGQITYHAMKKPNLTPQPRRVLGDVVTLTHAINFLKYEVSPSTFGCDAYTRNPQIMKCLFLPPYTPLLKSSFNFPIETCMHEDQQNISQNDYGNV